MRRFLAWAGGVAGGLAAYRFLTRRPEPVTGPLPPPPPEPAPPEPELDPRAAELRAKLDATREPEPEPPAEETPEERRARIHERGRSAVEEMRRSD